MKKTIVEKRGRWGRRKSDYIIRYMLATSLLAHIVVAVSIVAGCNTGTSSWDLEHSNSVSTGIIWGGGGGGSGDGSEGGGAGNSMMPNFRITGGYVGPALINYMNGETLSVTVTAAGTLEYASGTVPTGAIGSIELTKPGLAGGNEEILIGREAPSDSNKIELNINGDGVLAFRSPVNGNTPIGSYAEFQLINADATKLGGIYKLEADLDMMGEEWTPVGGSGNEFIGIFDGGDHTLSNLPINQLFGTVSATVENLYILSGGEESYYVVGDGSGGTVDRIGGDKMGIGEGH
ncbi:hypothetical protein FACS1894137_17600 [Spirochaetia bacterium]|nr:hypothetical protein FACS1894137_17600 [Spirochaetia bacterium]